MRDNLAKAFLKCAGLGLCIACVFFAGHTYPAWEMLMTMVIVFVMPVLTYLLFRNIYIVLIVLLLCLKVGAYFFPMEDNFSGFWFSNKYIRLIVIFYAVFKVGKLFALFYSVLYKASKINSIDEDYYLIIQKAFQEIYLVRPRYAHLIAQEFAVLVYGIWLWKKPVFEGLFYSYTRTSTSLMVYTMILLVAVIETLCLHLVLFHFRLYIVSFLLLFLNMYTALGLIAHLKAMKMRPIMWSGDRLLLKNGLFADAEIDLCNIDSIELTDRSIDFIKRDKKVKMALMKKIEMHNIKIALKEDISVRLFYGIRKTANEIYFYVDDKTLFCEYLRIRKV